MGWIKMHYFRGLLQYLYSYKSIKLPKYQFHISSLFYYLTLALLFTCFKHIFIQSLKRLFHSAKRQCQIHSDCAWVQKHSSILPCNTDIPSRFLHFINTLSMFFAPFFPSTAGQFCPENFIMPFPSSQFHKTIVTATYFLLILHNFIYFFAVQWYNMKRIKMNGRYFYESGKHDKNLCPQ